MHVYTHNRRIQLQADSQGLGITAVWRVNSQQFCKNGTMNSSQQDPMIKTIGTNDAIHLRLAPILTYILFNLTFMNLIRGSVLRGTSWKEVWIDAAAATGSIVSS